MTTKLSLGVLVSGNGSNLQAIIDNCSSGDLAANVSVVISDNPKAYALTLAKKAGIPAHVFLRKEYLTKTEFEEAIISALKKYDIQLVCLAGFMRILSPVFLNAFPKKIINIHPALLPAFPGLHAQKQALEAGADKSGCTVHFVDEGTDTGPIIIQKEVPILGNDTEESLSNRILAEEHVLYSRAIKLLAEGKLEIDGRSVVVRDFRRGK